MTAQDHSSRRKRHGSELFNYLISVLVLVAMVWAIVGFRRELAALINGGSG